jgi:hypothetical protein
MKFLSIVLSVIIIPMSFLKAQESEFYNITPIELNTSTGTIYGSLTMPVKSKGRVPVVLIIAGSGPTDRDGNNQMLKNNSLKQMADSLALNGIASIRYDKRGIGESKKAMISESDLRFDNYIQDAADWIKLMRQNKSFSKIIVVGHSEGSLIGMNAAKYADGFVSVAGLGNTADIILKNQLGARGKEIQDMCFPIIDSLKDGKLVANINPNLSSLFRQSIQPYMISWFSHNPQLDIKELKYPSLIVQGDNDLQVGINEAKLLASSNPKNKLVIVEKMNHVLKIIDSGDRSANTASYSDPNLPIASGLIGEIVRYVKK